MRSLPRHCDGVNVSANYELLQRHPLSSRSLYRAGPENLRPSNEQRFPALSGLVVCIRNDRAVEGKRKVTVTEKDRATCAMKNANATSSSLLHTLKPTPTQGRAPNVTSNRLFPRLTVRPLPRASLVGIVEPVGATGVSPLGLRTTHTAVRHQVTWKPQCALTNASWKMDPAYAPAEARAL